MGKVGILGWLGYGESGGTGRVEVRKRLRYREGRSIRKVEERGKWETGARKVRGR
jgi:hypothetical protein